MIRTWEQYQKRIQDHVENNHSKTDYDDLSCTQCSPAKINNNWKLGQENQALRHFLSKLSY